jgi:AAA domain, putative AbiEii toxin, Type IV TA system
MPKQTDAPPTVITADSEPLLGRIRTTQLSVLCGRNNSGKSFVLRQLARLTGEAGSYLGPARYQNFIALGTYGPRENRRAEKWNAFTQNFLRQQNQNVDNSPVNLSQAIAELSDVTRDRLRGLLDRLLGSRTEIVYTIPNNTMSQQYMEVDGFNLSYTSSGFRLVATLLTALMDTDHTHFFIDEPELGLSPEIQGVLADFLLNPTERTKYFPHMQTVVLATHSPIFLDRLVLHNNYVVTRDGASIGLRQIQTVQDLSRLQFLVLGNRFETLYLPSVILLVEGSCDFDYINRVLSLRFQESLISVIRCDGDARIKAVLAVARQMFTDLQRSPYADRIFVVVDSVHGSDLQSSIQQMGVPANRIIEWDRNGIEHVYPPRLLEQTFGAFEKLSITGDDVSANGRTMRKTDLAASIVRQLTPETELPQEFETKLLRPIASSLY